MIRNERLFVDIMKRDNNEVVRVILKINQKIILFQDNIGNISVKNKMFLIHYKITFISVHK